MEKKFEPSRHRLDGKLIIALGRAMQRTHQESTTMLRENGLTPAQFMVLELLQHKGESTVQQIIDGVLSTSGNMTVVLRNLAQRGLVRRHANPTDKRSFLIALTPEGKTLIDAIFPRHMDCIANALAPLSEQEKTTVVEILRKLK